MKRAPTPPAPGTDKAAPNSHILQKVKANWQDPLFGGMVLASLLGLIYVAKVIIGVSFAKCCSNDLSRQLFGDTMVPVLPSSMLRSLLEIG